jgi:hypothetical protein
MTTLGAFTSISNPEGGYVSYINASETEDGVRVVVRSQTNDTMTPAPQAEITMTREDWAAFLTEAMMNSSPELTSLIGAALYGVILAGRPS